MDMVVQFSIIHKARTPCDHVFDHPLVQLMEDVRSNGEMDIAQRKPHPERPPDSAQHAALLAKLVEVSFRCCQVEGVQDRGKHGLLSMRGPSHQAFWTGNGDMSHTWPMSPSIVQGNLQHSRRRWETPDVLSHHLQ